MKPETALRKTAALLLTPLVGVSEVGMAREILGASGVVDDAIEQGERAHRMIGVDVPRTDGAASPDALVLTHGLSAAGGGVLDTGMALPRRDALRAAMREAAGTIGREAGDDHERRFLTLWRSLPDYARDAEARTSGGGVALGGAWGVLPSDAQFPFESAWDRASLAAAVAGALDRPAFLLLSLGPVQGFIELARTTRDLWSGSYLLSWLSWQCMRVIAEEAGPDAVLYPSLRDQPLVDEWLWREKGWGANPAAGATLRPAGKEAATRRVAGFPNKVVALVEHGRAQELAARAQEGVRRAWRDLADRASGWLLERAGTISPEAPPPNRSRDALWADQVGGLLETYAAVLPWPEVPEGAPDTARALEAWLDQQARYAERGAGQEVRETLAAYGRTGRAEPGSGAVYGPAHALSQTLLDARKQARRFGQAPEPGFKCTLCGMRQPAAGDSGSYRALVDAWADLARLLPVGTIRPGGEERLCAVCLTRRLAGERGMPLAEAAGGEPHFPSTSSLATVPFKEAVLGALQTGAGPLLEAVRDFVARLQEIQRFGRELGDNVLVPQDLFPVLLRGAGALPDEAAEAFRGLLRVDGDWLHAGAYDRHLRTSRRRGALSAPALEAVRAGRAALLALRRAARARGLPMPGTYYAVLLMDGDRMGRWISGTGHSVTVGGLAHPRTRALLEQQPEWTEVLGRRRLLTPVMHATISGALSHFARHAASWAIERHLGALVYAGGDDVLALLPCTTALRAADELRRLYSAPFVWRSEDGEVRASPPESDRSGWTPARHMGPEATMSAGIAFAHHQAPLASVLRQVRRQERAAKNAHDRDALSVAVVRHSGSDLEFGGKWRLTAGAPDGAGTDLVAAIHRCSTWLGAASGGQGEDEAGDVPTRLAQLLRRDARAAGGSLELQRDLARAHINRHVPGGSAARGGLLETFEALGGDLERFAGILLLARFLNAAGAGRED